MVYIKREIEQDIIKWIESKEIIAIRGTRQCGKTTLLKRIIEILLDRKISNEMIHFINFEDDFEKEKFEKNPLDYIKYYINKNSKVNFFLLDEIQYIKNAGKILKLIYDEINNIKIIITGSSTLDLNEISSYLVGRVILFEMYPFSFGEFLQTKDEKLYHYYVNKKIGLKDKKIKFENLTHLDNLNKGLKEYIIYGGYPAVVIERDYEKKKVLLKNLFQTYVEKDIVKVYGSKYKQRITDLIKYLSSINTHMINYSDISKTIHLYDKEVKEILHILEETYIIRLIKPYFKNLITELKKNPKVYFIDTGLKNFISENFNLSNEEYGKLLENYTFMKIKNNKVNYWRTTAKAEVDFILDSIIPIECKINQKVTRSFRSFIQNYRPETAIILNLNEFRKTNADNTKIFILPFSII